MLTLKSWLVSLKLEKYLDVMEANSIDLDVIRELSEQDFASLGIALGDTKRLLKAMRALPEERVDPDAAGFQESATAFELATERPRRSIGELRQMTIMFVDLVNSTGLVQELGIEQYRDSLKAFQNLCVEATKENFGYVAQFVGDGVVAYFGHPVANEDDAERGVLTALEIIEKVSVIPVPPLEKLSVRIGIATGDVLLEDIMHGKQQVDSFVLGDIPNLAARLQTLADPGQIAISGRTRRLLGYNFRCTSIGKRQLKGFSNPVSVWLVEESRKTELRFEKRIHGPLTPLIGREGEFNLLRRRWNAACRGEGQAVFLSGEAGLGKSRLAEEIQQTLVLPIGQRLSFQCSPYHENSSFFPIKSHIINAVGLLENDTLKERESKLKTFLEERGNASDEVTSLFSNLLSFGAPEQRPPMPPEEIKTRTFEILQNYVERASLTKPVFILFEDLQWIDPSSEELLNNLLERIDNLQVMVLGTYRPEYTPRWTNLPKVTTLSLPSLGARETARLLEALVSDEMALNGLMETIITRSEGVPLFVEEMASMLARSAGSNWSDSHLEQEALFPSNLKDLFRARLDHLSVAPDTISICAALGQGFSSDLVAAVAGRPVDEILSELQSLARAQTMVVKSERGESSFSFRHALISDVAYEAILPQQARSLHLRIAETMVARFANLCARQPEILALHYKKAEQFDAARDRWHEAAKLSLRNYASNEAIAQMSAAIEAHNRLEHNETSDQIEIKLRQSLAVALEMRSWGSPDITRNLEKLIALNEKSGDHEVTFTNLHQLIGEHLIGGRPDAAWPYCKQMTDMLADDRNAALHTLSEHNSGLTSLLRGEFDQAISHLDLALEHRAQCELSEINRFYPADTKIVDMVMRCWARALQDPEGDKVLSELERAIAKTRAERSEFSRCYALSIIASIYCTRGEPAPCLEFAKEAYETSKRKKFKYWEHWSAVLVGWAETRCGEATGVKTLRDGLEKYVATGSGQIVAFSHSLLADALLHQGDPEDAAAEMLKAREVLADSSIRFHERLTNTIERKIKVHPAV